MRLTAKIRKLRLKDGTVSYRTYVIHNYRCPITPRPTNKQHARFPAVRSTDVNDYFTQLSYWRSVNEGLLRLSLEGKLSANNSEAIMAKLAQIVPYPTNPLKVAKNRSVSATAPNGFALRFPFLVR